MNRGATGGSNPEVVPNGAANLNATVKLVCDRYTPRPHFIVLKNQTNIDDSDDRLYDQTFILVTDFLRQQDPDNSNAILSFHRGSWYRVHTGVWHCHLCVTLALYTAKVKGKFDEGYMTNLSNCRTRARTTYKGYQKETVAQAAQQNSINVRLPTSSNFEVAWMSNEPRLVICQKSSSGTLRDLFNFFGTIENELKPKINRYGSHFCLFVPGESGTNTTSRNVNVMDASGSIKSVQSVGYMQLGSTDYYCILPDNLKSLWLAAFKNNDDYTCET